MSGYPFAPAVTAEAVPCRVSVVVVHYSGEEDLRRCCASVLAEPGDVELVVVDNRSQDGAVERLPEDPRLRRLWRPDNGGFAEGANAGLAVATGDVVMLLNPDAALRPGCLAALAEAHADLPMPARTYGQHATPTSFGAVVATWGAPLIGLPMTRCSSPDQISGSIVTGYRAPSSSMASTIRAPSARMRAERVTPSASYACRLL